MQRPRQSWRWAHASRPANTCGWRAPILPPGPVSVCCSLWAPVDLALGQHPRSRVACRWHQAGLRAQTSQPEGARAFKVPLGPQMASPVHAPPASATTSPAINSRLQVQSAPPAQEAFNSQPPPQGALCCPLGGKPLGPAPGQLGGSEMSFKPPPVISGFNFLYEICTFPPRALITWYLVKTFTAASEGSGRWANNAAE